MDFQTGSDHIKTKVKVTEDKQGKVEVTITEGKTIKEIVRPKAKGTVQNKKYHNLWKKSIIFLTPPPPLG